MKTFKEEACRVKLEVVPNALYSYTDALTIIFNNVRNDGRLLHVSNDSGNNIYVDCPCDCVDEVKSWLDIFGNIIEVTKVLVVKIDLDYDYEKYDDVIFISECL